MADHRSNQRATTDDAGRFRFTGLPVNMPLSLRASCSGYVPAHVGVGALKANEERYGVILAMGRGAVIAGRVKEPDGKTAFQGYVRLDHIGAVLLRGAGRRTPVQKDGTYRFEHVPPGRYTISVRHPEYLLAESVDVEVAEGGRFEDMDFVLRPGLTISGTLLDADGKPVDGGRVMAEAADVPAHLLPGIHHRADSYGDGSFEITGLPPGPYRLTAWARRNRDLSRPVRVVTAGASDIVLRFTKLPEKQEAAECWVEGRVHRSGGGKPVMAFSVSWWRVGGPGEHRRRFVDPEGRFRFDSLRPGTYLFEAATADGAVTPEPVRVVLGADGKTPAIDLRLDASAGVTGRILSPRGDPLAEARIEVVRNLGSRWRTEDCVISRRDGRYEARGLAPGEHVIRPWHSYWIPAESRFAVTVGQTRTIDLQLSAAGGTVQVVARDPAGRPIRDVIVGIRRADRLPAGLSLGDFRQAARSRFAARFTAGPNLRRTDSNGEVVFRRVTPGHYVADAYKPGYRCTQAQTKVFERVTTRADVVLTPFE